MSFVKRVYEHPKFLPIFAFISVVSFVVATVALAQTIAQDQQLEDDRIAADLAGCERGNIGRQSDIDVARATEDLIDGILRVVFSRSRNQEAAASITAELEPLFEDHRSIVDRIKIIDCKSTVPGARTTTPTTRSNP